jgi:hypothetical protein
MKTISKTLFLDEIYDKVGIWHMVDLSHFLLNLLPV